MHIKHNDDLPGLFPSGPSIAVAQLQFWEFASPRSEGSVRHYCSIMSFPISPSEYEDAVDFQNTEKSDKAVAAIIAEQTNLPAYFVRLDQLGIDQSGINQRGIDMRFSPTIFIGRENNVEIKPNKDPRIQNEVDKRKMFIMQNMALKMCENKATKLQTDALVRFYNISTFVVILLDSGIPGMDPVERISATTLIYQVDTDTYMETRDLWKQVEKHINPDQTRCIEMINNLFDKGIVPKFSVNYSYLNRNLIGEVYYQESQDGKAALITKDQIIEHCDKVGLSHDWINHLLPENIDK